MQHVYVNEHTCAYVLPNFCPKHTEAQCYGNGCNPEET